MKKFLKVTGHVLRAIPAVVVCLTVFKAFQEFQRVWNQINKPAGCSVVLGNFPNPVAEFEYEDLEGEKTALVVLKDDFKKRRKGAKVLRKDHYCVDRDNFFHLGLTYYQILKDPEATHQQQGEYVRHLAQEFWSEINPLKKPVENREETSLSDSLKSN